MQSSAFSGFSPHEFGDAPWAGPPFLDPCTAASRLPNWWSRSRSWRWWRALACRGSVARWTGSPRTRRPGTFPPRCSWPAPPRRCKGFVPEWSLPPTRCAWTGGSRRSGCGCGAGRAPLLGTSPSRCPIRRSCSTPAALRGGSPTRTWCSAVVEEDQCPAPRYHRGQRFVDFGIEDCAGEGGHVLDGLLRSELVLVGADRKSVV